MSQLDDERTKRVEDGLNSFLHTIAGYRPVNWDPVQTDAKANPTTCLAGEPLSASKAIHKTSQLETHFLELTNMTSSDLRDYATVAAAVVALLVFMVNSFSLLRNRRIENLARYFEAHQRLFEPGGYMASNIGAIEAGRLVRDRADEAMEAKFHLMLLEIEQLAILANNRAVPRPTQVYMLGSYTRHVLSVLTEQERSSMFWELAIGYLDGLAKDTAHYETLTRTSREAFWR